MNGRGRGRAWMPPHRHRGVGARGKEVGALLGHGCHALDTRRPLKHFDEHVVSGDLACFGR
jgi:hypothetical protein